MLSHSAEVREWNAVPQGMAPIVFQNAPNARSGTGRAVGQAGLDQGGEAAVALPSYSAVLALQLRVGDSLRQVARRGEELLDAQAGGQAALHLPRGVVIAGGGQGKAGPRAVREQVAEREPAAAVRVQLLLEQPGRVGDRLRREHGQGRADEEMARPVPPPAQARPVQGRGDRLPVLEHRAHDRLQAVVPEQDAQGEQGRLVLQRRRSFGRPRLRERERRAQGLVHGGGAGLHPA
jgi:hypothetical protein